MKIPPQLLALIGVGAVMAMASQASAAEAPHAPLNARPRVFAFPAIKPTVMSERGITFLKNEEGFRDRVYQDVGKNAIGYGHNFTLGDGLKVTTVLTEPQADALLRKDLVSRQNAVAKLVGVPLTQSMFDALVSLVYNIGGAAFKKSTLLARLNARDYEGAAQQFDVWINAGGKVDKALVGRRNREHNLFLSVA